MQNLKGGFYLMGIFLILLSIAIVILLVFKGVPVFYSAFIASLFCLLTAALFTGAGVDVGVGKYLLQSMTDTANTSEPQKGVLFSRNLCNLKGELV